jgi:hypothetical protein
MNRLLTILLLLGATAHGQINNPPTSVNIVDATATGRAVLTAANAAGAATAVGLGTANDVTFNRVQVGGATFTADAYSGGDFEITGGHALTFASGGTPGATLTNLGLGAANNVTFSNITASGTLGVTSNATFSGTANLAPSQTASSGASLMTRDLVDNAAAYDASFGPTYAVYSQTTNSATAAARLVAGLGVQTGSATNGRSCVALGDNFWSNPSFSGALLPSTKAIDFYLHGVTIVSPANTNWVARVIFGQGQPTTRIPPAAGEDAVTSRSWGVEFYNNGTNNVSCLFWHNGTTLFKASEQVLAGSGSTYIAAFKFSQDGDGGISFTESTSSAGRIPNTPTFSTNVVFGGGYFGRYILIEAAGNTNQAQSGSGAGILTRAQYIRYVP